MGIGFEVAFSAALVYLPPLAHVFGLALPPVADLVLLAPFPFLVWGADEVRKTLARGRLRAAGRTGTLPA